MIESLRESLEALHGEGDREYYLALSGQKDTLDIATILERHASLFAPESIDAVRSALSSAEGDEERRLRYLLAEQIWASLDGVTARDTDAVTNAEGEATVPLPGGGSTSFRNAPTVRDNEPDRARRAEIGRGIEAAIEEVNPQREDAHRKLHEAVGAKGLGAYVPLFESLTGIDLRKHRDDMQRFLDETDDLYRETVGGWLRDEIGVPLEEAELNDLRYLVKLHPYRDLFPKERIVEMGVETVRGMGIDPTAGGKILIDIEERPKKDARAFCAWVRIPDEVYLVTLPAGGPYDIMVFLHEYGHAQHAASIPAGWPVEFARLGDNSVTEAYAMTFDHLLLNEAWLREIAGIEDPASFIRAEAVTELIGLRRYAAKIAHEVALHEEGAGADLAAARERYAELLRRAYGFPCPGAPYLFDVDPHFYCARYVRAWHLEAVLSETLLDRHGPAWFREKGAGEFLRGLWATGQKEDADEIARRLGAPGLDVSALIRRVTRPLVA
jgi:hypothetical protein